MSQKKGRPQISDSLQEYRRKRDFSRTPEPNGKVHATKSSRLYVIQKHAASRLHYDFRLEFNGVLKSWAVPKGPSLDPAERRLAVQVEDHPVEYGSFEGIIPEDEYGGGTVMLWDRGEWEPKGDPEKGLQEGTLAFRLNGKKLHGVWALARMHGEAGEQGKNWLLIKKKDEESVPGSQYDVLEAHPLSVASGRSIEQIAEDRDRIWVEGRAVAPNNTAAGEREKDMDRQGKKGKLPDPAKLTNARRADMPQKFHPQLATLVSEPPEGDQWLHEIKYDGYRILCFIKKRKVTLLTRHSKNWTSKFDLIVREIEKLRIGNTIFDGEIVVLNPDGTTNFQALQNILKGVRSGRLVYYIFDIPFSQGYDLTQTPLLERKQHLRELMVASQFGGSLRYGDYIQGSGPSVFQHACRYAVEGLVSKRADGRYIQRRTRDWVKVKCLKQQEFVVGGYTEPSGSRKGFGALLIGYYRKDDLIYCGRVGTGFTEQTLGLLSNRLFKLEGQSSPFKNPPTGRDARGVHWVTPKLVAEVEFSGWTDEGILRHPSFKGLREDKEPREVSLEKEQPAPRKDVAPSHFAEESKNSKRRSAMSGNRVPGVKIAGVSLSNPDRVLYPEQGVTKRQLALFYEEIADWILPYVVDRPLTLVRCPYGHQEECFYQKHLDEALPDTMRGIPIEEKEGKGIYVAIDDLAGLISLVQLGVLEIHPWGARADKVEQPDMMVFDLDPGPDTEWSAVIRGARLMHERLDELGLENFVKTTGGKGLHVVVPLTRRAGWDEVKAFSKALAEEVAKADPKRYIATMSKAERKGRIFVDYVRNSRGATSVAAYSTRARQNAPVSTPLEWDELSDNLFSDAYTIENLPQRLNSLKKDPWQNITKTRQSITKSMRKELGIR